jgi:hypothetical protein
MNKYAAQIESADDSYESRKSWHDSVPRLNWKADEACLNLLKIIASELFAMSSMFNFNESFILIDFSINMLQKNILQLCLQYIFFDNQNQDFLNFFFSISY